MRGWSHQQLDKKSEYLKIVWSKIWTSEKFWLKFWASEKFCISEKFLTSELFRNFRSTDLVSDFFQIFRTFPEPQIFCQVADALCSGKMVLSIDGYRQFFIYTKDTIYHYFLASRLYIAMAELLNLVIIKLLTWWPTRVINRRLPPSTWEHHASCLEARQGGISPVSWHQRCLPKCSYQLPSPHHEMLLASPWNHQFHQKNACRQKNKTMIWWLHIQLV